MVLVDIVVSMSWSMTFKLKVLPCTVKPRTLLDSFKVLSVGEAVHGFKPRHCIVCRRANKKGSKVLGKHKRVAESKLL